MCQLRRCKIPAFAPAEPFTLARTRSATASSEKKNMKTALSIVPRVIALTIILFICFAVAAGVVGLQGISQTPERAGAATSLLAVCFLNTVVLTHIILRSRWAGWRLMATVYFIAWQNPAVREYYGGIDEGSFFARMGAVLRDTFWLIPFQILRAMLWAVIALPVIRMMKGQWLETALAIGLLFAVNTAQLLLPNPYMPEAVRMTHLIEVASSNFIFGLFVGWLLTLRVR